MVPDEKDEASQASPLAALIAELEKSAEFLKNDAAGKLDAVVAAHPEATEVELLQHYEDELRKALTTVNPTTVLLIGQRSFLQLRQKKAGYNKGHVGLG